jgi:Flp pilus assembly protein CpaB
MQLITGRYCKNYGDLRFLGSYTTSATLVDIGCAAATAIAAWSWWPGVPAGNSSDISGDTVSVLVAEHFIPAFQIVNNRDVSARSFPKEFVPPGALRSIQELHDENNRGLFSSAIAIPEGQPVTRTLLAEIGKNHGMSCLLAPGKVAVSFAVDSAHGAGGWVQPGDTVAVLQTTIEGDPNNMSKNTRLLFPALEVLAVDRKRLGDSPVADADTKSILGQSADGSQGDGGVLTVMANPLEAARLVEAREKGTLSIVLRAMGDDFTWPAE